MIENLEFGIYTGLGRHRRLRNSVIQSKFTHTFLKFRSDFKLVHLYFFSFFPETMLNKNSIVV